VVGIPWEEWDTHVDEDDGAVAVIYGSSARLTAKGNQLWSQDSPGILDQSEPDDHFGESMTGGDFNGDGISDLAVGVPWEDTTTTDSGAVAVILGTSQRLTAAGNQLWTEDTLGIAGGSRNGDRFGIALGGAQGPSGSPRGVAP